MKRNILLCSFLLVSILSVAQPGIIDTTFKIGTGPNNKVLCIAIQPNGKIWVGGAFDSINGVKRSHIALLNEDGTVDNSFDPLGGPNGNVHTIALVGNGQIMIGGNFTDYDGVHTHNLVRLNSDGSRDATFNTGVYGFDGTIKAIAIQSDGKINVGGSYSLFEGNFRNGINRLNPNGTEDPTFHHASTGSVEALGLINDSLILIGGIFYDYDGIPVNFLAKLNNGKLDTTFKTIAGYEVYSIEKTSNDGFLIGGSFEGTNSFPTNVVARLKPDGSLDSTFSPITFNPNSKQPNTAYAVTERPDGKVIAGGAFNNTSLNFPQQYIAMFNTKGNYNSHFLPNKGTNGIIRALKTQTDGKVIVGGEFTTFANSNSTKYLTRMIYCNTDKPSTVDTTVCSSYNFAGIPISQPGTHIVNDMSVVGCDSTITLNLTVDEYAYLDTIVIDTTTCGIYQHNEFICHKTGKYTYEITNEYGCKLIKIVNLTINSTNSPVITSQPQDAVDCNNNTVAFELSSNPSYNYQWYYVQGGDSTTGVAADKCNGLPGNTTDSMTIINPANSGWMGYSFFALVTDGNGCVTKSDNAYLSDHYELQSTVVACNRYLFGDNYLETTGTYQHTFQSIAGCDSIVTLDITLNIDYNNINSVICKGDSLVMGDSVFTTAGNHQVIFKNFQNCDSIINITLTVDIYSNDTIIIDTTTCGIYQYNEFFCYKTGQYIFKPNSPNGCKQVTIVNLTIISANKPVITKQPENAVDCSDNNVSFVTKSDPGYSYNWYYISGGDSVTGYAVDQLFGVWGESGYFTDSLTITQPATNSWYGYDFFATVTDGNGCVIKSKNVSIADKYFSMASVTACDSFLFAGNYLKNTGTYQHTFTSLPGCDSIAELALLINNYPSVNFDLSETIICSNHPPINLTGTPVSGTFSGPGITNNIFDPSAVGTTGYITITYSYTDNVTGCSASAKDSVYMDVCTGITSGTSGNKLIVSPNPTSGYVTLYGSPANIQLIITNSLGETVLTQQVNEPNYDIDMSSYPVGIYFIKINSPGFHKVVKLIRQ